MKTTQDQLKTMLLAMVAVLLAVDIASRITPRAVMAANTGGGIPDSGAQLQAVVDSVKSIEGKIDNLQSLLESGKVVVQTKSLDEKK